MYAFLELRRGDCCGRAAAARIAPSNPRYAYVYAVALNDAGKTAEAVKVLEHSLESNPYYRVSIAALINFCERLGDHAKAQKYERLLEQSNQK